MNQEEQQVLRIQDLPKSVLESLLRRYFLHSTQVADGDEIPGSFWGAPEAGIQGMTVQVRGDTPLHSALHETCHTICMDPARRQVLDTDAGGEDPEECAVCYLQIILAATLPGVGSQRLMVDMDRWGYSFRLGSTRAWFEKDAEDARAWLLEHSLIDSANRPTWRLRE